MAATYEKIATTTLASNQGTVTFSSIPQTYTDLRLIVNGGYVDAGFLLGVRVGNGSVNADSNYSYTILRGDGSSATSVRKSNMTLGALNSASSSNVNNTFIAEFQNYSNTTTYKTWLSRSGLGSGNTEVLVSLWRSTAAIDTIAIAESGDGGSGSFNYGNMLAGSTFTLYGILKA